MACFIITLLSGCDLLTNTPKQTKPVEEQVKLNSESLLSAANLFAYTQLSDTLTKAQALDSIIGSFLHHPNPGSLEEAQQAWVDTYNSYLHISFFYSVPRFEKPKFNEQNDTYRIINEELDSWPIEPGYIDYLPMYPLSGIVNDLTLKITEEGITEQHGFSDKRYASIGFHPLEFLLFGADSRRSAKDFIPQDNNVETISLDTKVASQSDQLDADEEQGHDESDSHVHEEPLVNGPQNHNRRREYLRLLSALNVQRLQKLTDRWEPAHGYYAKQWRQPQQLENLQRVYQASVDTLQQTITNQMLNMLLTQNELDDLRSPFSQQDITNIYAMVDGINMLFNMDNGFIGEIKLRHADVGDKIIAQFKRLLKEIAGLPSDTASSPLKTRQARLKPIQGRIVKLIELLYSGAASLDIPLRELPVSTS